MSQILHGTYLHYIFSQNLSSTRCPIFLPNKAGNFYLYIQTTFVLGTSQSRRQHKEKTVTTIGTRARGSEVKLLPVGRLQEAR